MNPSGMFRAFSSVVSASITAAVLLSAAPARSAVTIDVPCAGTWNWNASSQTLSCSAAPPQGPGTPVCSLAANPSSLSSSGGTVALTATCSNSPTSYQWSPSGVTFAGGATTTVSTNSATISANTTFTVTATNEAGSGQASRSVQVGQVVAGLSCPGFTKTLFVNWDWDVSLTRIDTWQTQGGLGTNGILVVSFVPTGPTDPALLQIGATNYPAGNMVNSKRLAISTEPCDLNPSQAAAAVSAATPTVFYALGTAATSPINGKPMGASLTPGQRYYINIAERTGVTNANPTGTQSCVPTVGSFYPNCELRLSLQKPSEH